MKRDLQNYYQGRREKIKNADAELFVAQLERKKEANSAFFYDLVVDEHRKLVNRYHICKSWILVIYLLRESLGPHQDLKAQIHYSIGLSTKN
jgi:hypothetical protein